MEEQTPPVDNQPAPVVEEGGSTLSAWVDSEGNFVEGFRDALPDGLGKHSAFDKYKNFTEFVKGHVNQSRLVGGKVEEFLKSEDPDHVKKRNEILGIPDTPEGYGDYEIPETLDKESVSSQIAEFRAVAKQAGMTKAQVDAAVNFQLGLAQKGVEESANMLKETNEQAEAALRSKWKGEAYDQNIEKAARFLDAFGLQQFKDDPAYGSNPAFIEAIVEKLVPLVENDRLVEASQTQSLATIQEQLDDLDDRMMAYTGPTSDVAYKRMMDQKRQILEKLQ
jgi:hypothetical protein